MTLTGFGLSSTTLVSQWPTRSSLTAWSMVSAFQNTWRNVTIWSTIHRPALRQPAASAERQQFRTQLSLVSLDRCHPQLSTLVRQPCLHPLRGTSGTLQQNHQHPKPPANWPPRSPSCQNPSPRSTHSLRLRPSSTRWWRKSWQLSPQATTATAIAKANSLVGPCPEPLVPLAHTASGLVTHLTSASRDSVMSSLLLKGRLHTPLDLHTLLDPHTLLASHALPAPPARLLPIWLKAPPLTQRVSDMRAPLWHSNRTALLTPSKRT